MENKDWREELEEFDKEFGDVWKIIEHTAGQSQKLERQNREIKNFLSTKLHQALAEDRERLREKIRKASIWKLVPDTPRMIMCNDKELDDLLSSLDKLTDKE